MMEPIEEFRLKSRKEHIQDLAHKMGIRILFEDDFKLDDKMIECLWSDGVTWRFTVSADPVVLNENSVKLNYKLNHTIQSPTSPNFL